MFVGLTGDITINENGDREADYTLNDLDPTGNMTVSLYAFKLSNRPNFLKDKFLLIT